MLTRAEAEERYEELPLPTTADEHWRFTDLRGFDPARFGTGQGLSPARVSQADARPGRGRQGGRHRERHRDPLRARRRHVRAASRRLRPKLVPDDDKFAIENLADWQHGLLVHVPKGVELEKPLYVQVTSTGGSLYWRMVVIADEGARFTLIEDLSSASPDLEAYTNAVVELFVGSTRRSSTSRCRTSRTRPGTSPATARGSSATASSTG